MIKRFIIRSLTLLLTASYFFYWPALVLGQAYQIQALPNDPEVKEQGYLQQIKAPQAWDKISQSPNVVVAVIDTGVDINHPDLKDNIWSNPGEVPGDNLDNDHNGLIDDYHGWDFLTNSPDPRPKFNPPFTKLGINHGTIVAGVIGAVGNNQQGISGLSWKIKIMPLRALDSEGKGESTNFIRAINYAIQKKADIINLSVVGPSNDPLLEQAISRAFQQGIIVVSAAGNEDANSEIDEDLDFLPRYPICNDGAGNEVLGVGAVDKNDLKSKFSNYGVKCIDLVAPGEGFFGVTVYEAGQASFQKYYSGYWAGTSVAAPLVSAAAALIKALRPDLLNWEIYEIIKNNTDNIYAKNPFYSGELGSGRLNVEKAILAAVSYRSADQGLVLAGGPGSSPLIKIVNNQGQTKRDWFAYAQAFKGGVNLAAADFNQDGLREIVTAPGTGGGPHVKIFSQQGELLRQFFAYDKSFNGGVSVAAGNVDADGQAEIVTAPQAKLKPLIKIFDTNNKIKKEFLAFDAKYQGGVSLALSDLNADGQAEIVASQLGLPDIAKSWQAGGSQSLVRIFDAQGKLIKEFKAYSGALKGGLKVRSANLYLDPRTELAVWPASGAALNLKMFSPTGGLLTEWPLAYPQSQAGWELTLGDMDNDQQADFILGQVVDQAAQIEIFDYSGNLKNVFSIAGAGFWQSVNLLKL